MTPPTGWTVAGAAIGKLVEAITTADARNLFKNCGYVRSL